MKKIDLRGASRNCAVVSVLIGLTACAGEGTGGAGDDGALAGSTGGTAGIEAQTTVPTVSTDMAVATSTPLDRFGGLTETSASPGGETVALPALGAASGDSGPAPAPIETDELVTQETTVAFAPDVEPTPSAAAVPEAAVPATVVAVDAEEVSPTKLAAVVAELESDERDVALPLEPIAAPEPVTDAFAVVESDVDVETDTLAKAPAEPEPAAAPEPVVESGTIVAELTEESAPATSPEPPVEPEPVAVAEPATESEPVVEPEPEIAAALPADDGYQVNISWNAAATSDLGYYVYYGEEEDAVDTFARGIPLEDASDDGIMTATLDAPGDLETGTGSRVCFAISAWNSVGETERSAVQCVDKPTS